MKFKKFLIIILSVALLSCFAVSTFATSATIPDYGFYISPGEYRFNDYIEPALFSFSINFLYSYNDDSVLGYGIGSNTSAVNFYQNSSFDAANSFYFYSTNTFNPNISQTITVLDGFYIYNLYIYQWWQSNVTRVDSGYDDNLLDGILSSFTFIGEWIAGAANAVTPMFWDGEALTVVGTLSVAGLSFAVVFLLIALVSSFMKFRS